MAGKTEASTSLPDRQRTTILRVIGDVGGRAVEITRETAVDPVVTTTKRFPSFQLSLDRIGVEIDLGVNGDEELWETVQDLVAAANEHEAVPEALLDGGSLQDGTASDAVRDLLATAAATEAAREVLAEAGLRTWDRDLGEAVDDMVATSQQLQENLVEMERQSIDRGQRSHRNGSTA